MKFIITRNKIWKMKKLHYYNFFFIYQKYQFYIINNLAENLHWSHQTLSENKIELSAHDSQTKKVMLWFCVNIMWLFAGRNGKRRPRHEQLHRRADKLHDARRVSQHFAKVGSGFSIQVPRFFLLRRSDVAGRWFGNLSGAACGNVRDWSFFFAGSVARRRSQRVDVDEQHFHGAQPPHDCHCHHRWRLRRWISNRI